MLQKKLYFKLNNITFQSDDKRKILLPVNNILKLTIGDKKQDIILIIFFYRIMQRLIQTQEKHRNRLKEHIIYDFLSISLFFLRFCT